MSANTDAPPARAAADVTRLACAVAAVALLLIAAPARAHPAPFSFLDLVLDHQGLHGSIVLHDLDVAHDLGVDPPESLLQADGAARHRDAIVALLDARLRVAADGLDRALHWTAIEVVPERFAVRLTFTGGPRPGRLDVHAVMFPYDPIHQTFVNVYEDGTLRRQAILSADLPAMVFYAGSAQGRLAVIRTFVASGVEHILIGPDHVLFLVGLLLLGGTLWRLAAIVTAFTVGHSITLTLASLDIVSPPAQYIEPLIALTIIVVGADNLIVLYERRKAAAAAAQAGEGRDARPLFAGAFGLIHGFGFASVLREFGLPRDALAWSLVSFNVGVELGQLGIVLVAAAALVLGTRSRPSLGHAVAVAGSVGVILAGAYWFAERLGFL
jgi:hypothetical protein